ncbi:MAG: hypothetical protein AAB428_00005, partial [Patescibacteria group bacterium]
MLLHIFLPSAGFVSDFDIGKVKSHDKKVTTKKPFRMTGLFRRNIISPERGACECGLSDVDRR